MEDYTQGMGLLSSLSPEELEILQRLQLEAQFGAVNSGSTDVMYGGGRLGYAFPMNGGDLTLGLSAGGYRAKGNGFKDQDFRLNGADASYSDGQNTWGGDVQVDPILGRALNLFYRRDF